MHSKFFVNETPSNSANEVRLKPFASFLGDLESLNTLSHLESCKSDVFLRILCFQQTVSRPSIFDKFLQLKKKSKLSYITTMSDNISRIETNLKWSRKYAPRFTFVSGTIVSGNDLT